MDFLKFYSKYIFLIGFIIIIFGGINSILLDKIYILSLVKNLIILSNSYLIFITLIFGFFAFYLNKEEIEEKEKNKEIEIEIIAKNRKELFPLYFPILNRNYFFKKISQWIYKEKWHGLGLFLTIILFWVLRLYNNDFVNGSDNHNVIGIKNLYENGISFYKYHPITDFLMIWFVRIFGFNFFSIKIPFLIYSFITLVFIYLIGRKINKNIGLLSSFLFTISPWAIIQSRITRDYSFDLMIASIVIYFIFIMYKKINRSKSLKDYFKYLLIFFTIPIFILLLYKYNRYQVITTGIYPLIMFTFIGLTFLKKIDSNALYIKIAYWLNITSFLIFISYISNNFSSFSFGFKEPNYFFFDIFLNPKISSPYQWFHNINIDKYFFILIFALGIFYFNKRNKEENSNYLLFLINSFIFTIFIFVFKYESHINYIPVRYLYFLFIPYVIIFSNSILNIYKLFDKKLLKIIITVFLFLLINPKSLIYSIKPVIAYEKEGIDTVQIDNIGIGRFSVRETAELFKKIEIDEKTAIVFSGDHEEFILYYNKSMDNNRFLTRGPYKNWFYDISKNTYVQSNYYGHFELETAIKENEKGFFASHERFILDQFNKKVYLREGNFYAFNTSFIFIERINNIYIYYWNNKENNFSY